ncbi:quinolinate synthase NadA [Arthrobacter sp. ISL-85]|uniref:quinolinate synthase NadA n=1 Tax=Arthrobacter sp. ISL-85 TaxID=2819115 RepID=UPI001BE5FF75|nr:quinolinate synthase NadA [Arthrobacter sp. ISL-85]MBT2566735.1 quinolinate synthase NadA [Arthrobacter sp. ISL-85]
MSSVNTAIQLITREQAEKGATADRSTCSPALAKGPWDYDLAEALAGVPAYGPGASSADPAPAGTPRQGQLPEEYKLASDAELRERIHAAKAALGDRAVILGHFYQRDEVIQYADFVGDSFQLANAALTRPEAEAIIFCGVHFMAETADILSTPEQAVILPNLAAGCSMADMADTDSVEECWEQLEEIFGTEPDAEGLLPVIPVTYMNSSAALKAFCGEHGGIVCTSSNAKTVLEWAFQRARRVLFFPDQHLGRNTAKAMGVPLEHMPMWNPRKELGGNDEQALLDSRVILWHGFCSVHKRFNVAQIEKARTDFPGVQVIVHPECPMEVVDAADCAGSTDFIKKAIAAATEPTTFAIGTEINMVNRLAAEYPQHTIFCLDPVICPCSTMYRIHPGYLAWVLEELVAGRVVNRITVDHGVQANARTALERMLAARP